MFSVSISDNLRGHGQITLEAAGVAAEVDINVTEDETFMCAPITANPIFNILLLGSTTFGTIPPSNLRLDNGLTLFFSMHHGVSWCWGCN